MDNIKEKSKSYNKQNTTISQCPTSLVSLWAQQSASSWPLPAACNNWTHYTSLLHALLDWQVVLTTGHPFHQDLTRAYSYSCILA